MDLEEQGMVYGIELKEYPIISKVKFNNQKYVLVNAEFDTENDEELGLGLSGLYVYETVIHNGTYKVTQICKAEKSISSGFTANLFHMNDKQILFGDLRKHAYNEEIDQQIPVNYYDIEVLDDRNIITSKKIKSKNGYIFLFNADVNIKTIQFLDKEGNIIDFASTNQNEEHNILNFYP